MMSHALPGAACALCLLLAWPAAGQDHTHAHDHEHEDHPEAERIVVTATPLAHSRDELALPVQRLDRGEVLDRAAATLGETVGTLPGVTTTGFASGASRPVIRGQDAFRTEVLEDSLTTQDVSRLSPDHAVPVNPLTARSVEIVRGPATLRYGGGAVAGVVNAITGRVPQRLPDAPATAEAIVRYGHNDDEALGAAVLEGGSGRLAWHVDGTYQRADDYETGKGETQPGSARDGGTAAVGGAYVGDRVRVGGAYAFVDSDYGIPEEDEDVEVEMRTHRYRVETDVQTPLPGTRELRILGVFSDYEHREIAGGVVGQTFDNHEFDGRAELLHEPWLGLTGAVGLAGRFRDFEAGGEAAEFLAPTRTRTVAGYAFEELPVAELAELQLGLRVEGTEVRGTPLGGSQVSRDFVPVSGSVGVVLHPWGDWTLALTGAASQRAPADVELFARGPHEATGTFERGDASLDEETAFSGELRLGGSLGPVEMDVASFITRYDGYIFGRLTGATVDESGVPVPPADPDALDELAYTAHDALFYGGEVALRSDVWSFQRGGTIGVDAQLDWVRARFENLPAGLDPDVPRIPPLRWGGGLGYRDERFRSRIGFLRWEAQDHPGEGETPTSAFTMVDLSFGVLLAPSCDCADAELTLDVKNLADEVARNPVAFNKDEVLLRGRSVLVGLRGRF